MPTEDNDIRASIFSAYTRLDAHQLQLFLCLRSLPPTGPHSDLAARLTEYDMRNYSLPIAKNIPSPTPISPPQTCRNLNETPVPRTSQSQILSDLPIDIIAEILDHIGSWELSKAVGVPTSLPRPTEWETSATSLDRAILSTSLDRVRVTATSQPFTRLGATLLVRFEMIDVLDYLWSIRALRGTFKQLYGDSFSMIPTLASLHDRPRVLDWWLSQPDINPNAYDSDAVDGACRNAALTALTWWDANSRPNSNGYVVPNNNGKYSNGTGLTSRAEGAPLRSSLPFPPRYTTQSLESASLKAHISVLSFFIVHDWPLRPGRSLDMASTAGNVEVLDWWAYESGLEIGKEVKYDRNAVYHASCAGKVEVLEWWKEQSDWGKGKRGKGVQMIFDGDALVGATRHNKPEARVTVVPRLRLLL